jgi:hypothetical protein
MAGAPMARSGALVKSPRHGRRYIADSGAGHGEPRAVVIPARRSEFA